MAQLYSSDNPTNGFDATTAGSLPSGWAIATGSWSAAAFSVLPGHSNSLTCTSKNNGEGVVYTGAGTAADIDMVWGQYIPTISGSWGSGTYGIVRSNSSATAGYAVTFSAYSGSTPSFNVYKIVSGTYTNISGGAVTGGISGVSAGSIMLMRLRVQGTSLKFRYWLLGQAEPSTWLINITDSSVSAAGYAALSQNTPTNGSNQANASDVAITTLSGSQSIDVTSLTQGYWAGQTVTLSGTYSGTTPTALEYSIDGGSYVSASSPTISGGNWSFSLTLASTAGTHTISVRDTSTLVSGAGILYIKALPSGVSSYDTTILYDNPVAYWPMKETSGSTITDLVAGLNGTVSGATINQSSLSAGLGPSILMGTSADVTVPSSGTPAIFKPTGSCEAWIKPSNVSSSGNWFAYNGNSGWRTRVTGNQFQLLVNGGSYDLSGGSASAGTAYHVVFTADSSGQYLYVNGTLVASNTNNGSHGTTNNGFLLGGDGGFGEWYQGNMSNAALYNYRLSSAQVLAHYRAAQAPLTLNAPVEVDPGATATFSGTYTGTAPTGIDYSLDNGTTWTTGITPTASGGNWSITFTAPSAGTYTVLARNSTTLYVSNSQTWKVAYTSAVIYEMSAEVVANNPNPYVGVAGLISEVIANNPNPTSGVYALSIEVLAKNVNPYVGVSEVLVEVVQSTKPFPKAPRSPSINQQWNAQFEAPDRMVIPRPRRFVAQPVSAGYVAVSVVT